MVCRLQAANDSPSGSSLMFKTFCKRRLVVLGVVAAAIGGAEITARYIGFGEPPLQYSMIKSSITSLRIGAIRGSDTTLGSIGTACVAAMLTSQP
jgi:hypothetical protein